MATRSFTWGRIELVLHEADFLDFNKTGSPFPVLKSLAIRIPIHPYSSVLWSTPFPSHSPNLQALNLYLLNVASVPALGILPASLTAPQLYTIIARKRMDPVAQIFECFPNPLQFNTWASRVNLPVGERLASPPMKSLLLLGNPGLLRALELPTLEHLEAALRADEDTFHAVPFYHEPNRSSISRSRSPTCPIRRFSSARISSHSFTPSSSPMLRGGAPTRRSSRSYVRSPRSHTWSYIIASRRDLLPKFEALVSQGLSIRVTTPNSVWPADINDAEPVGDLVPFAIPGFRSSSLFGFHLVSVSSRV
ncbi:hypothetical protein C8R44DRAFT_741790 [Mycena epipterygia]|nr:hypothetical protein C8R44DRAFT_741790 [Mycena epipterygia]